MLSDIFSSLDMKLIHHGFQQDVTIKETRNGSTIETVVMSSIYHLRYKFKYDREEIRKSLLDPNIKSL